MFKKSYDLDKKNELWNDWFEIRIPKLYRFLESRNIYGVILKIIFIPRYWVNCVWPLSGDGRYMLVSLVIVTHLVQVIRGVELTSVVQLVSAVKDQKWARLAWKVKTWR